MAASRAQEKPSASPSRARRHACEWPWAGAQIIAVSIVVLSVVVFYAFSAQELQSYLQRIVLVLVSVQVLMVVLLFVSITLLDPAHPAVIERRHEQGELSIVSATQSPDDSTYLEGDHLNALTESSDSIRMHETSSETAVASPAPYTGSSGSSSARGRLRCALCEVTVSTGTRHCSVCRKCVVGFDHHCVYLNTCIGTRNYPLFIALLTCSISLVSTQLVIACFAIDRLHHRGATGRAILVSVLCVLPLLQLVSMLILALFHSYLSCKGLKTYQWLQRFNQQQSMKYTAKTPTWHESHQTKRQLGRVDDDLDADDFREPLGHSQHTHTIVTQV